VSRLHAYDAIVTWTGNRGTGTSGYRDFDRAHDVAGAGRATIAGSSDPAFRGDPTRWNPEQLLVVSLSQCHMLWYLHLAAEAGVVVTDYVDRAVGTMAENADGSGQFVEAVLRPTVTVAEPAMAARARQLHGDASAKCFIARSVNFPVRHEPTVIAAGSAVPNGDAGAPTPIQAADQG
jgi:organic hydroperoxide reductase OsmC/OhrA